MKSGNAVSSDSDLIPSETLQETKGGISFNHIAKKKNLKSLRSAAFFTIFVCNLVHAHKFQGYLKTARNSVRFSTANVSRKRPAFSVAIDTFNLKVCVGADEGNDISDHIWALFSFCYNQRCLRKKVTKGGMKHFKYHLKPRSAIVT